MMHNKSSCLSHSEATQQEKETLVLWDINGCPIPDGYAPRLVGPTIESALKNSGYAGPLTITAIGDLRMTPDKALRELSSTGIALDHGHDIWSALDEWTSRNPSPATIMLISGPSQLELLADTLDRLEKKEGYIILLAYLQRDPALWESDPLGVCEEWLWKSTQLLFVSTREMSDNKHETTRLVLPGHQSPWYCSVCCFAAQSFEDLSTHLKSVKHAYSEWNLLASHHGVNRFNVKPEPPNNDPETIKEWESLYNADMEARLNMIKKGGSKESYNKYKMMMPNAVTQKDKKENKTFVLWHINSCPIPHGYDPRLVRPRIESAVKNSGLSGSLTITAVGNLIPTSGDKVLRELSSTGIDLEDTDDIEADLDAWTDENPPPATIMLISGPSQLVCLSPALHRLHFEGYTILLAYPQRDPAPDWLWIKFLLCVQKEWLWKNLLKGEMDSESADKTGESPRLLAEAYEDYLTHRKSKEYAHSALLDAKTLMEIYKKKLKNRRTPK